LGNVSLHSTGKTKFKGGGPGLGLPITKGVIEAHGGAIWVESEGYDEERCPGSVFHILLPIRKSPPDDKASKLFRPSNEPAN
jgi:signal transduction histidine kinase